MNKSNAWTVKKNILTDGSETFDVIGQVDDKESVCLGCMNEREADKVADFLNTLWVSPYIVDAEFQA